MIGRSTDSVLRERRHARRSLQDAKCRCYILRKMPTLEEPMMWQTMIHERQTRKHSSEGFTAIDKSEVENTELSEYEQ